MRVAVPEIKEKSKLFAYLKSNRKKIIAQKCSSQIKSDDGENEPFHFGALSIKANDESKIGSAVKKHTEVKNDLKDGEIEVDAVANMAGWCDSYMDVLIPDCWENTIKQRGASNKQLIYHLKNHEYSTDAIVGGNVEMRSEWLELSQFNFDSDLSQGQALIGKSIVKEKYDKKCFHLYSDDEVKQHSIGLRYIKILLCLNSDEEDDKYYKENWDEYYKYVINKDKVDSKGYFWAVVEIKLVEYSAVLYGANELTPVQSTSNNKSESPESTKEVEQEPEKSTNDETSVVEMLNSIKF